MRLERLCTGGTWAGLYLAHRLEQSWEHEEEGGFISAGLNSAQLLGKGHNDCRGVLALPGATLIALMVTAWKADDQVDRQLLITHVFV